MTIEIKKAERKRSKLKVCLCGPSGSGKSYTGIKLGTLLAQAEGKRLLVGDTEYGSASLYGDEFDFDVTEITGTFEPQKYIDIIRYAENHGYGVVMLDSLSHAWFGAGGELDQVDKAAAKSNSGNTYFAWRNVTPQHNALVDAMIQSKIHVIATMRVKSDYVIETNERGKQAPKKVGLAPIMRDGMEYEFTVVADIDLDHNIRIGKTRCIGLDGKQWHKGGEEMADILLRWMEGGKEVITTAAATPSQVNVDGISDMQLKKLMAQFGQLGITDKAKRLEKTNKVLNLTVTSAKELTRDEAGQLITALDYEIQAVGSGGNGQN